MKAGRDLDKLVHVHFMGGTFDPGCSYPWDQVKAYSTELRAAWEVWTRLSRIRPAWAIGRTPDGNGLAVIDTTHLCEPIATGDTHLEAICLAALETCDIVVP